MTTQAGRRELLGLLSLGGAFAPLAACFAQPADHPTHIYSRDDSAYAAHQQGYNKRLNLLPRYIALCQSAEHIQQALQLARTEGLKVAVRSGGHCFEGFSSNDGGLVVNVSLMKKIRWLNADTVDIEAGCTLQEIQAALFARRRLLPSGSCGSVGISGLTLGGGYGFFSRKFGLTCDSLLDLSMVAPSGKLVDGKSDPELLWACKGGGNGSFGVVNSLRFKTQAMPLRFDSHVMKFRNLDVARFEQALRAWFALGDKLPPHGFSAFVLNGKTLTVLVTGYEPGAELRRLIAPLRALATSTESTLQTDLPKAMRRYYGRQGPINFKNASAGLYSGLADILRVHRALFEQVVSHPGIVFQINTLGGRIADPAFEQASCYPHRHLPYLGELQAYWEKDGAGAGLTRAFESIQALFRDNGVSAHYANYPDIGFKHWEHSYYGDNYPRLQQLKRRYDPGDLLHHPQSVRPS